MIDETKLLVYLTSIVFDTEKIQQKSITFNNKTIKKIASIDEINSWTNGLQAVAYEIENIEEVYIVIRGADVGIGKKFFKKTGASERFIPQVNEEDSFKTVFQDWIYTSTLGSMGLVHLYQYDSLKSFYISLKTDYPQKRFIVSGVSLGGLLAQRLYILEEGLDKCISFSALSPWWTFNKQCQNLLKRHRFLEDDKRLVNYYSNHDMFRFLPFFNKQIGVQKNVLLQPFQSRSNFIATLIERLYWAHIPNYYTYTDKGLIRTKEDKSRVWNLYRTLNDPAKYSFFLNTFIGISCVLLSLSVVLLYPLLFTSEILNLISINEMLRATIVFFGSILISILFFIPTLTVKTNWKYPMFALNLLSILLLPLWFVLFILSIIFRSISNR